MDEIYWIIRWISSDLDPTREQERHDDAGRAVRRYAELSRNSGVLGLALVQVHEEVLLNRNWPT